MQECGCLGYGNQLAGQCIVDHGLETMSGLLLIVWPLDILLERLIHVFADAVVAMALFAYNTHVAELVDNGIDRDAIVLIKGNKFSEGNLVLTCKGFYQDGTW